MRRTGIPTSYGGLMFRSRHEATWAACFDELGLPWDYEPVDLDGYIPDFDLRFAKKPLLVEVKGDLGSIEIAKLKLDGSGWEGEAAIVVSGETARVGAFYDPEIGWDEAVMGFCLACSKPTLCAEGGRWQCRGCGADARQIDWSFSPRRAWRAAQNVTQWRKSG
jgi:hypothetical protein